MKIKWILIPLCTVSLVVLMGCASQTPAQPPNQEPTTSTEATPDSAPAIELATTPVPSPATPTPRAKPNITLPAGKGAFYGKMMWGDKPVVGGGVIADTENPIIISFSGDHKRFTASTDRDGNYVLVVEPDSYYVGCSRQSNTAYHTYETWGGFPVSHEATIGEFTLLDLEINDWSIELVSPGNPASEAKPTLRTDAPVLTWEPYNWIEYDGQTGYYMVELGIIEDGYQVVLRDTAHQESYQVTSPLEYGEYKWEVQAFSSSGKELAGTESSYYFFIPSSVVAPRSSSPEPSMQTQVIVAMPGIDSITDLDGKKLGMGTTEFRYAEAALNIYNIECSTVAIPSQELWLALQREVVDAVLIANHPSSDLQAMIDSSGARILPWSSEAIQALIDQFPEVAATVLPANTYHNQDRDIMGFTIYQ